MKTVILSLATLSLSAGAALAAPVTEEKSWTETWVVTGSSPRLEVSNIWGSVQVRVGPPGRITASVTESRSAPDRERFERSKERLKLSVEADASGVAFVVGSREPQWQNWNDCRGCRVDYQFDIEVPPDAVVDVGTVMDGKVDVRGVTTAVSASNVNGPVTVVDVGDCKAVTSINGSVMVSHNRAPIEDCRIETLNGDVTLTVPADAGLDLHLDLFNGDVRSDLPATPLDLPATVEQTVEDNRTRYRIAQMLGIRIGAGGPVYSISSMNGDLHIRKHP
jgi:hypothetical protein